MKIEALHEFHNADFSKGWADRFEPTPPRLQLFETILQNILVLEIEQISILELGIGPGFLANYLLEKLPKANYEGLDFSEPMLEIATQRTKRFGARIAFTQADLINDYWINNLKNKPSVIVSTLSLIHI